LFTQISLALVGVGGLVLLGRLAALSFGFVV